MRSVWQYAEATTVLLLSHIINIPLNRFVLLIVQLVTQRVVLDVHLSLFVMQHAAHVRSRMMLPNVHLAHLHTYCMLHHRLPLVQKVHATLQQLTSGNH